MSEKFGKEIFENNQNGVGKQTVEKKLAESGCNICLLMQRAYKALDRFKQNS